MKGSIPENWVIKEATAEKDQALAEQDHENQAVKRENWD
jgi:hypothetical protein